MWRQVLVLGSRIWLLYPGFVENELDGCLGVNLFYRLFQILWSIAIRYVRQKIGISLFKRVDHSQQFSYWK